MTTLKNVKLVYNLLLIFLELWLLAFILKNIYVKKKTRCDIAKHMLTDWLGCNMPGNKSTSFLKEKNAFSILT